MDILSYGYKVPRAPDLGATFFPAIEYNFTRLNAHNHDGNNSSALSTSAFALSWDNAINAVGWVATSGGMYRQLVTMPPALTWNERNVSFRDYTTGEILYLEAVKVSVNTYYVYTNDNTLSAKAMYV